MRTRSRRVKEERTIGISDEVVKKEWTESEDLRFRGTVRKLPGGDVFSGKREIVGSWRFCRVREMYAAEREK